jgi:hypothetical protein
VLGNFGDDDRLSLPSTLADDAFSEAESIRQLLALRVRVRTGQRERDLMVLSLGKVERAMLRIHHRRQLRHDLVCKRLEIPLTLHEP